MARAIIAEGQSAADDRRPPSSGLPEVTEPTARPCDSFSSIVLPLLTCGLTCRPNRHQRRVPRDGLYIEGVA